jgi:starch-binding outer membrane protein, SusD/RagB family
MKKHIKALKKTMVVLTLGAVLGACESYTNGVDEFDPTRPRNASLGQVINSAEVAYIGFVEGELARIGGMWSGQFTGTDRQYAVLNSYTSSAPDYDNPWGNIYAGVLKPLRIAQQKATAVNNKRALALAQILEAHTMASTAALFGDIPYSQTVNLDLYPNPAFDTQTDVYNTTLTLLDRALGNINTALAGTFYDGDIFFTGTTADDAKWIAVANTVKAKIYLHLGQYQNALNAASLGIDDADNDVVAVHGSSPALDTNIYGSFLGIDRQGYLGALDAFAPRLLDQISGISRNNGKTNEEDRFEYSYTQIRSSGVVVGYDLNYSAPDYDEEPEGYFGMSASFGVITYRENQLILAEAALRINGFTDGLAALNDYRAYLNAGGYLNPVFFSGVGDYLPYAPADFVPGGMENASGALTAADALYREIIEEKYISLLGSLEVFNDVRRKGFGSFASQQNWQVLGITPNEGTQIPQRFLIAQVEINSNSSAPQPSPGLFDKTKVNQ